MFHAGCNTTVPGLLTAVFLAAAGCDRSSEPTQPLKDQGPIVVVDPEGRPWRQGPDIELQWPDDPRVDIARELLASGKYAETELVLRTVLSDRESIGRARFLLGIAMQKQKHYAAALELLDAAVATGQPFPEARHGGHFRGWCLYHLGRPKEAQAAFEAHLVAAPGEGDSHFGLGILALEEGQLTEAQTQLERAIELQAENPGRRREVAKAHARLGDVHLANGEIDAARQRYHTAVIRWPDHYEAWAKLARVLDRLDRGVEADRARAEYQNARKRRGLDIPTETTP